MADLILLRDLKKTLNRSSHVMRTAMVYQGLTIHMVEGSSAVAKSDVPVLKRGLAEYDRLYSRVRPEPKRRRRRKAEPAASA